MNLLKKVVRYDPTWIGTYIELGYSAMILPLDHPDGVRVSNGYPARTSVVREIGSRGVYQTKNTVYKPVGVEDPVEDNETNVEVPRELQVV